jgi:hypothetical protein
VIFDHPRNADERMSRPGGRPYLFQRDGRAYGETSMSGRWPARARPSRWLRGPIPAPRLPRWLASLRLKAERRDDHGTQSQSATAS